MCSWGEIVIWGWGYDWFIFRDMDKVIVFLIIYWNNIGVSRWGF